MTHEFLRRFHQYSQGLQQGRKSLAEAMQPICFVIPALLLLTVCACFRTAFWPVWFLPKSKGLANVQSAVAHGPR
jgi:hypothetical protein